MKKILLCLLFMGFLSAQSSKFYTYASLGGLPKPSVDGSNLNSSQGFIEGEYNYLFWKKMSVDPVLGLNLVTGAGVAIPSLKVGGMLGFFFGGWHHSNTLLYFSLGRHFSLNTAHMTNSGNDFAENLYIIPLGFSFNVTKIKLGEYLIPVIANTHFYADAVSLNRSSSLVTSNSINPILKIKGIGVGGYFSG